MTITDRPLYTGDSPDGRCPRCGRVHSPTVDCWTHKPIPDIGSAPMETVWVDDPEQAMKREARIEALRAASRVVAGQMFSQTSSAIGDRLAVKMTLEFAEQFARWLETGGR